MITRASDVRLRWVGDGWWLDVPTALSADQIRRIAAWALPRQVDRWRSLPPGEKKDECRRTIDALKSGLIQQRIVNMDGTVFTSTERVRPERTIFVVGGDHG